MELPYRWNGTEGRVRVEVRANDDPEAVGCDEMARGFPVCHATVDHPAIGYADLLGWVQLVESSAREEPFYLDYFEPLGHVPQPFSFYGLEPVLFDAPHSDELENWDFLAHSFLCGLGGRLLEFRHEVRAVLGFSWGFSKRGQEFEYREPQVLVAADWDGHLGYLGGTYPGWTFAGGFHQHPSGP
ncbi:MAG TPA: hypothetical protein VF255_05810 [Solirubrobacterales bacterium]